MGEEIKITHEKYFQNLGKQLGRDLGQCLHGYKTGSEEERHETAVRLVEDFLELGGSPNAVDENYWPILTIAVTQSCAPLVALLLEKGADVNFKYWINYGVPDTLYAFVMSGGNNLTILEMILQAGANLDGKANIHGNYRGNAEDWLVSDETLIKPDLNAKILKRIRHERSRRAMIQNVYEFKKVTKPSANGISASVLRDDEVDKIVKEVLQRIPQEEPGPSPQSPQTAEHLLRNLGYKRHIPREEDWLEWDVWGDHLRSDPPGPSPQSPPGPRPLSPPGPRTLSQLTDEDYADAFGPPNIDRHTKWSDVVASRRRTPR
jgi:hypothetical protein